MHLLIAFRAFFRVLFNTATAAKVESILDGGAPQAVAAPAPVSATAPTVKAAPPAGRSDALTLLAALQREARFLDFLNEDLTGFGDAQIGAVARDVHRDSRVVIERLFGIRALDETPEGARVELPAGYDPTQYRLLGNAPTDGKAVPVGGALLHPGWIATRCDVPAWNGADAGKLVLAPAEVEVK
ncbi:MAG: DUF2760 domain-containing protein [Pirellulales bacterium]